ncbi:DUF4168 domain-containing protein [Synechococcus sp. PCC 6312]|uniref:DUF4168 domain-containing protein n=1 Tax=Synechococcus sp. (strain ATCC 27167 / PCC 6312) TaxID=195253 RepID=UPI00155AEA42|nr:DUF4168 domain-containing protein [Synechococcus sp. PCC 6312]
MSKSLKRLACGFGLLTIFGLSGLTTTAQAQVIAPSPTTTLSNSQLSSYAQAVLAIEPIRLKYYRQAQKMFSGQVPRNSCLAEPKNLASPRLDNLCSQYFNESTQILKKYDLTPEEFNNITQQIHANPGLYQRVQYEMMRLQKK